MKIGLDLRMFGGGSGIGRYISELTQQILEIDKNNEYVLFFNKIDDEAKAAYSKFGKKMVETNIHHYSLDEQFKLPSILNKEKLDLVHFPHFNAPLLYGKKFIVTIHDLTHTKFPGKKKSHLFHRAAYNLVLLNAIKRSKKIIAVSNSTKQEIKEYFSLPDEKIKVVYEGFNSKYGVMDREVAWGKIADKFKISKPFLLYVGVWRRYKNLPALAQVFSRLVDQGHDIELVLAGEPDSFYPEIKDQVFAIKHKDKIRAVGRVSDENLNYLYNACRLFVLPSLAEGFGLTALEAAACGAPIAAADIPTLREILGQGAEFFDPKNNDNMYDVLNSLIPADNRLEELANLGLSRSKHFSWKQAAQETISIYESFQ
jgi:glycosyltransferase involved in cell wall biosynthesis